MPEKVSKSRPHVEVGRLSGYERPAVQTAYAELAVTSNFTFLRGGSHPDELVEQAAWLGYEAVAITDTHSLAGIVRAHVAAKEAGIQLVVGTRLVVGGRRHEGGEGGNSKGEVRMANGGACGAPPSPDLSPEGERGFDGRCEVLVYPVDLAGYGRLCRLLTVGKRRAEKGGCVLTLHDLAEHAEGLLAVVMVDEVVDDEFIATLHGLREMFDDDRLSIAASVGYQQDDAQRLERAAWLAEHVGVPLVATNDVLYHHADRQALQDVLTCIRHGCTIEEAGFRLAANAERYLKPADEMARLFAAYPRTIERTVEIARRCSGFNLDQLKYQYPHEVVPTGRDAMAHLAELTWAGAKWRYPGGLPSKVRGQIEHELRLIESLDYPHYFLTVHDIIRFANERKILCQGRGAAANSAVCYCLGITAVDPDRIDVLFERFVSKERDEPPDIDVDFEHERREEVIQYLYAKYGRERAALTGVVITYRARSAVRDVGKALGFSLDAVDRLAKQVDRWGQAERIGDELRALGFDPSDVTVRRLVQLTGELMGFPRHLSQHVGGFVLTDRPLCELVPIENAAMPDRTVIEWDKDDIDAMGFLKVDVLGLGMLTCVRKCFDLLREGTEARRHERRHEGTEARRHEGGKGGSSKDEVRMTNGGSRHEGTKGEGREGREQNGYLGRYLETWESADDRTDEGGGDDQNISRSGGMAEGDDAGAGRVRGDKGDVERRAVRADDTDAAGGDVGAFEHRGGLRAAEPPGLRAISADGAGLTGRASDAARVGDDDADARGGAAAAGSAGGDGPRAAGPDPQSPITAPPAPPPPFVPACLRASVPSFVPSSLADVPAEDPAVYDMICDADTVGVFQIESRAQMQMLPRLRPRCFYDLVIEVAIVRPGPIQGDMVHPYLRRRDGLEPVTFPDATAERVLGKTLGVPLFQEQAMNLAIQCAGFTPGEAEKLRRTIQAWRSRDGKIMEFGRRIIAGMLERGYPGEFADRCFEQIKGFGEYGFPESHAASFALLVYVSAWLKCHHPAAFACALLNAQPMGFYAPAQIVRDAKEHGVAVRPVDVNMSGWDCLLESRHEGTEARRHEGENAGSSKDEVRRANDSDACGASPSPGLSPEGERGAEGEPALRLGMRLVKGLAEEEARRVVAAVREHGPFDDVAALWRTAGVRAASLRRLAEADAFTSMGLSRQRALWQIMKLRDEEAPLFEHAERERRSREAVAREEAEAARLPRIKPLAQVTSDYAATGLSLKRHPVAFIRDWLTGQQVTAAKELRDERRWPHRSPITVAGLVFLRQRPGTAAGVVFMTLEDETGIVNLIVRPEVYDRYRAIARDSRLLLAQGRIERRGKVVHVSVRAMHRLDHRLPDLAARSRDFH